MITLKRFNGAMVTPRDDALLFDFIMDDSGIFEGIEVTHLGANQLAITAGRGIVKGRDFTAEARTLLAALAESGTSNGRLIIRLDMSNDDIPIQYVTQVGDPLPALVQEDINRGGSVYELPIATYTVTELQIENLVSAAPGVSPAIPQRRRVNGKPLTDDIILDGRDITAAGYVRPDSPSAVVPADTLSAALGKVEAGLPITLTHSLSGTVHTLSGLPSATGMYVGVFTATANFAEGDTFAGAWTAKPGGEDETLPDRAFVMGDVVTVGIDAGGKRLGFKLGGGRGDVNETLPTMPEDFLVLTGDEKADLSFTVPTENYGGAIIVRKLGSVPNSPKDGVVLQASSGTCEDASLINGEKYYWRLYPYNEKGQYQTDLNGAVVYGWPLQIPTFEYTGSFEKVESFHPTLGTPRYYAKLLSSGTLTFNTNATVDVFCVGGGGSANAIPYTLPGGGGGKTTNSYGGLFTGSTYYSAIIGAGGNKSNGGNTTLNGITATGGGQSTKTAGGAGGSGGGGNAYSASGGTNGNNGSGSGGGLGQGTTTRPFDGTVAPFNAMQFAGGGGAGGNYNSGTWRAPGEGGAGGGGRGAQSQSGGGLNGQAGVANTGGGGGGGGSYSGEDGYGTLLGGGGGSGIVIIRVGDWSA